jgi:signal transduction histidine kinase
MPRRRWLVVGLSVAAVVALAAVDDWTGPYLSMEIFYLIPVAAVTVLVGKRSGRALAAVCTIAALLSNTALQSRTTNDRVTAVNAVLMLVTLLIVAELIDRLRTQALLARRAEQQSREFLAFAAHQLKTPVTGIGATVDALSLVPDASPERDELLVRLRSEVTRAGRLINSLLRVARLDQHEALPSRVADVGEIVRLEVDRARRLRSQVAWTVKADESADLEVVCSPTALAEAVANLLDNAGRHALSNVTVTVGVADEAGGVEIVVFDDGAGVAPDDADVVFERFVSLDQSGGSGLGLPIARGIVEAHGGSLVYDGRSFVIRLPRRSPSEPFHATHMVRRLLAGVEVSQSES